MTDSFSSAGLPNMPTSVPAGSASAAALKITGISVSADGIVIASACMPAGSPSKPTFKSPLKFCRWAATMIALRLFCGTTSVVGMYCRRSGSRMTSDGFVSVISTR